MELPRPASAAPPGAIRPHRPRLAAAAALAVAAIALAGCEDRAYQDGLDLPPGASARFIASGPLTPQSAVLVLAQAPPLRALGGAIEITGGSEIMVVQPQAWRSFTGTALSVEEASRELARARRLDASLQDLGAAADELLELLHERLDQPPAPGAHPSRPGAGVSTPTAPAAVGGSSGPGRGAALPAGSAADPGSDAAASARARELTRIGDAALDRLQRLLEAQAQAQERSRQEDARVAAVEGADQLEQADERAQAQRLSDAAATGRDGGYRERLQQAQRRDAVAVAAGAQADDLAREQSRQEAQRAGDEAARAAIAQLHAATADELRQWLAGGGGAVPGSALSSASAPESAPRRQDADGGDGHAH